MSKKPKVAEPVPEPKKPDESSAAVSEYGTKRMMKEAVPATPGGGNYGTKRTLKKRALQ